MNFLKEKQHGIFIQKPVKYMLFWLKMVINLKPNIIIYFLLFKFVLELNFVKIYKY